MTNRTRASWLVYALGALSTGAIVAAFLVVGPPSQSATVQSRIVTVAQGVVQSTVSGSGNIQAASQLDLGFKTGGVVQRIYASEGKQVLAGQLLAELDPQSAEVTLEQAKASLQAAEATLAQEEESGGETSSGQGTAGSSSGRTTASTASSPPRTPATPTTSTTTTQPATTTTPTEPTGTTRAKSETGSSTSTTGTSSTSSTTEKPKQSAATREANLASAKAAVRSDLLAMQSDEQSVADTKLYAPESGTIVSLSGEVGETVSGTGTTRASAAAGSSSATGSAAAGTGGTSSTSGRSASAGASSSSSSSSGSSFAVLSDLSTMQLVVPLSESEVIHVHAGQPATVTVEALEGAKLAAHVESVATLSTSNSGVVSYDVTFQLDQIASGMKPGMSASAEVVVEQAEGVSVPTTAISAGSVTVVRGGKRVRQAVVTGLAGNSSTIVLGGLKAGEQIALPIASTSSATSLTSRLGSSRGGSLGGGLGGGGGGFAGAGFARGGG